MALTLTGRTDKKPCPRVDILFDSLAAGTATATVYQISDEGKVPVRNAEGVYAAGGLFVTDYEVPLGVPVTYTAEQFDASGVSLGYTTQATVQVDSLPGAAWVQDPLDPSSAVEVGAADGFADEVKETREVKLVRVGNDTVALMAAMGLIENVSLRTWTDSPEDAAAYRAVLRRTQVLVRTMPNMPIPRCLHIVAAVIPRRGFDIAQGGTLYVWDLVGDEVTRSALNIIVPVVTWQRYIDAFPTWGDFDAAYGTWLDALENPPAEV